MEFDETRWSRSWNSDKNGTQNSARVLGGGPGGWVGVVLQGVEWVQGVGGIMFDMKLTLSVWHNCLKLKMTI